MIPPITKLLIKIEQLEWDLAEVKKELEALQPTFMKSLTPEERGGSIFRSNTRTESKAASIH